MCVVCACSNVLHILRPAKAPGFAYAWLELVSHRIFVGRVLAMTPQQRVSSVDVLCVSCPILYRDVPDIQFRMAGIRLFFYSPVPVPSRLFPETGYLNRIIVVHSCGP